MPRICKSFLPIFITIFAVLVAVLQKDPRSSPLSVFQRHWTSLRVVCGFFLLSFLLGGCSQNQPAKVTEPLVRHSSVHGGQQPVSGGTLQLYAVGTTGDGSPATPLLTQAVTSAANGIFDITGLYTRPSP